MSLLTANNLSLYYGERAIFEDFSFQVNARDRIGLVGRNGSGKTSLLRLIIGDQKAQAGDIVAARGLKLGYLAQDASDDGRGSLLETVLHSIPEKTRVEARIREVEKALAEATEPDEQTALADEISRLYETREHFESVYAPHLAERILCGLGFSPEDFVRPLAEFSGGWRTRAALAALLYQKPDLLLMDEPTNHLDVDSVRWLGQFLLSYSGAMVLVCHDREFLNPQINRIISFEAEGPRHYRGNYEEYLTQRAEEEKILERQARNQEQKVREAEKFIERFRYKSTKARQAQSKIKVLEKMELVKQYKPQKTVKFQFPEVPESGRTAVRVEGLSKSFGDNALYEGVDLFLQRGERVAVIGRNGTGKTTLLKIIAGELAPDQGEAALGHGVTLSYYAQHQAEQLNPRNTVVEEVYASVPDATLTYVRSVCGSFLFSGDDVDKPISVLSGGEKARVALAKLLVKPGNLLVMDEPTNHLDIISSELLIEALKKYNGTLLFVSHNQAFVNRLATKIWDIREHHIEEYPGKLKEYYDHLERLEEACAVAPEKASVEEDAGTKGREDKKARKREEAQRRQELYRKTAPIKKRVREAEARIAALEAEEQGISEELADPEVFADPEKSKTLLARYNEVKQDLDRQMARWEADNEALEKLESES